MMRLEEFLQEVSSIEDVVQYDFKNESPWEDVKSSPNAFVKFIKYKEHNRAGERFDCDSCSLAKDVYEQLWGWNTQRNYSLSNELQTLFKDRWDSFGTDTMNSVQTILTQAKLLYQKNPYQLYRNKKLKEYISLTHTIGNFSLVPYKLLPDDNISFNQCRGSSKYGKYYVKDFFDLSLKIIKENTDEETFKNYIDTFLLNDYVDKNYNVLPLFSGHKELLSRAKLPLDNPDVFLPRTTRELKEFLNNSSKRIKARGERIAQVLDKSLQKKHKYPRWMNLSIAMGAALIALYVIVLLSFMGYGFNASGGFSFLVKNHGFFPVIGDGITVFAGAALQLTLFIVGAGAFLFWGIKKLFRVFAERVLKQCPCCKKLFAIKKVGSKVTKEKDIQVLTVLKTRDSQGNVTGTQEKYIPGKRQYIDEYYACKNCDVRITEKKIKDYKNI